MTLQNNSNANRVVKVKSYLKDMVPGYLENREKDIQEIGNLISLRDFEQIKILGHRMKGSGSGYGFEEISRCGLAIERGASAKDIEIIKEILSQLKDYLEKVEVIFE
jgi:hypothetical protein